MTHKKQQPSPGSKYAGLVPALGRIAAAPRPEETPRRLRAGKPRGNISSLLLAVEPSEESVRSENALAIFAKPPIMGRVKTRLIGPLTPRQAADVHLCCIRDSIVLACAVREARCCFFAAPTASKSVSLEYPFWTPVSPRWKLATQRGMDLGARMASAFRELFSEGAKKVVIIGTDSPWMGRKRILRAFRLLDKYNVVLGPAVDGGYYLVGAKKLLPQMFRGVDWGTSRVLRQTLRILKNAGVSYALLKQDFDLDRPSDLRRLRAMWKRPRSFPFHLSVQFHLWKLEALTRSTRRR